MKLIMKQRTTRQTIPRKFNNCGVMSGSHSIFLLPPGAKRSLKSGPCGWQPLPLTPPVDKSLLLALFVSSSFECTMKSHGLPIRNPTVHMPFTSNALSNGWPNCPTAIVPSVDIPFVSLLPTIAREGTSRSKLVSSP